MFGGIATKFSLIARKTVSSVQQQVFLFMWGLGLFQNTNPSINLFGLGNVVSQVSRSPVQIGSSEWNDVDLGSFTCTTNAISKTGTLWGWGRNAFGGVGDGTTIDRNSPVQVGALTDWKYVYADTLSIVARKTNNTLWVWGFNAAPIAGLATSGNRSSPIQIGTDSDWAVVGNRNYCVIAIKSNNTLWGRGNGQNAQLLAPPHSQSPAQVGTASDWSMVGGLETSFFGIKTNGTLWSWGPSRIITGGGSSRPAQIGGETNWVDMGAFHRFGLLRKTDNTLWSFGYNNNGQLGRGTTVSNYSPAQIGTDTNWASLNKFKGYASIQSSFAIKTNGTLWAWGNNFNGNLGLGNAGAGTNRSSPVQIGTDTDWSFVSSNSTVSFAIKTNGTLWGWGVNGFGQLGNGTVVSTSSPVQIGTDTDWKAVYCSPASLSVGVKTTGTLWAWGRGGVGLLSANRSTPIQIGALTNWNSFIFNNNNGDSLAVKTDGSIWHFGYVNERGKSLIQPTVSATTNTSPVLVSSDNWTGGISSGCSRYTACGIKSNKLYLWGRRRIGGGAGIDAGTGLGDYDPVLSPRQLGSDTWKEIKLGLSRVFGIKTNGTLWAWGSNSSKILGLAGADSNFLFVSSPVQIGSFTDWEKIFPSNFHNIGIRSNGTLWAWGNSTSGELGLGASVFRSTPVQVGALTSWFNPSARGAIRGSTTMVINSTGQLWGWGSNYRGEMFSSGKNQVRIFSRFELITGTTYSNIYATGNSVIAKKSDKTIWTWGENASGQLGILNATRQSSPVQVASGSSWDFIATSNRTVHGIRTNGTLWAWGDGAAGILGNNNTLTISSPVQIGSDTDWSKLKVPTGFRTYSGFAIKTNNTLWAWGNNTNGRLGVGNTVNRSSPTQVGTDTNWSQVASGNNHTLALRTNGTLWAWGLGTNGELGNNTAISVSSPVQVGGLTGWTKISVGSSTSFAIRENGTLWTWGLNTSGELGLGNAISRSSPVQIGTATDWSDVIAASYRGAFALKTNGTLWAWGRGLYLGLNSRFYISSPVQVGTDSDWSKVLNGRNFGFGLKTSGQIFHTGDAVYGINQIFPTIAPNSTNISSPVLSDSSSSWKKVVSVSDFSGGLKV